MIRMRIKEPSEKEFQKFKSDFLRKRSKDYYEADTRKEIDSLMRIIGGYQSRIDELECVVEDQKGQLRRLGDDQMPSLLNKGKRELKRDTLKKYVSVMLNELLFNELKNGHLS